MTTSNTASPLSTTRQDKETSSHSSARARECRECAGDVCSSFVCSSFVENVRDPPTRLSTTRAHARPTRHHGDLKYWPRRSPSASRGGRPGSPCGPTLPSRTVGSSRGGTTRRRAVRRSRAHDGPCPTFWRRGRPHFRSSAALIGLRGGRRSRWATIQCDAAIEMGDSQRTPRNRGVRVR